MRKTFKLFCAAAIAALTVSSCGKIWDEFDSVHGQLDSIEARLDSLETALNSQVATINTTLGALAKADEALAAADKTLTSKLEAKDAELAEAIAEVVAALEAGEEELTAALEKLGEELGVEISTLAEEAQKALADAMAKVAVQKVDKNKAGNYVLTFADGTTLEVAAADANANNTDLVTVVEGEWHVILADGTTKSLGVAVGHVDLVFEVDYETMELLYSVDGGETFEGTGAYVANSDYYLVTDFYEEENYVTICVGGAYYNLPKVSDATAVILAGKTYFVAEATKVFPIKVNGIKSAFVASSPKGWEASLDMNELELTVKAPAAGTGAAEGVVEVWLLTEEGTVITATVAVAVGDPAIEITVDPETYDIEMVFNEVGGETPEVIYGVTLAKDFTDEFFNELLQSPFYAMYMYDIYDNLDEENPETAPKETSVEGNIVDFIKKQPVDYNGEYVVWAFVANYDSDFMLINTPGDVYKVYQKLSAVSLDVTSKSILEVEFDVEFMDPSVTAFYGIYTTRGMWNSYKSELQAYPEYVQMVLQGGATGFSSCLYEYDAAEGFSGKLSDFGWTEEMKEMYEMYDMPADNGLTPGTEAVVVFAPYVEGKEYTYDDLVVFEVGTTPLTNNPSSTMTATIESVESDYFDYEINVNITGAEYMYYFAFDGVNYEVPTTVEEVLKDIHMYEFVPVKDSYVFAPGEYDYPESGTTYTYVTVLVDETGECKVLLDDIKVTTKSLPYTETFSVAPTVEVADKDSDLGLVKFAIKGDADYLIYNVSTSSSMASDKKAIEILTAYAENPTEENWGLTNYVVVDLTDPEVTLVVDEEAGTKTYSVQTTLKNYYTTYGSAILLSDDAGVVTISKFAKKGLNYRK